MEIALYYHFLVNLTAILIEVVLYKMQIHYYMWGL